MTLIGMLHHRADPEKVKRSYAYASAAKSEGAEFFYFTAGKVDINRETILGKKYEDGKWIDKEFPFPDVIFNASYPATENGEKIIDHLYERIPFTSHSIGNKLTVYEKIKNGKQFEQYLIPSAELSNLELLFEMVHSYSKVIIKPLSGNQGGGILFIEEAEAGTFKINDKGKIYSLDQERLVQSIKDLDEVFLIQPFITCKTKAGNVFDFRLHVQKAGKGEWVITSIFPRIGPSGSIASNLGGGGYTCYLEDFLRNEFDHSWFDVKRILEYFAIRFASHFDTLYDQSLDELGIDVGIDENQKLWIFEVNWRPGIPVIFRGELDVAKNTILYAKYLAAQKSKA
ncbi:YheC/YheD family protein [Metabacillus sp. 84]|uniref:YheC/YheD family endospore coat-associated protein n=1 Tax=Metabacillus sp. 84 TaxID=3404705 RepID=UPI003CF6CC70